MIGLSFLLIPGGFGWVVFSQARIFESVSVENGCFDQVDWGYGWERVRGQVFTDWVFEVI